MENLTFYSKLSRFLVNWFFMMIVWIAFTTSFAAQELIVGVVITAIISFFSIPLFTCCTLSILSPTRVFYMIYYLIVFTWELIKSNLDVCC